MVILDPERSRICKLALAVDHAGAGDLLEHPRSGNLDPRKHCPAQDPLPVGPRALSWDYAYEHRTELDDRLKRAGIRIAAYLNWVFEDVLNHPAAAKRKSRH